MWLGPAVGGGTRRSTPATLELLTEFFTKFSHLSLSLSKYLVCSYEADAVNGHSLSISSGIGQDEVQCELWSTFIIRGKMDFDPNLGQHHTTPEEDPPKRT